MSTPRFVLSTLRIQNQKPLADGTFFYKNSFDVARKVVRKESLVCGKDFYRISHESGLTR